MRIQHSPEGVKVSNAAIHVTSFRGLDIADEVWNRIFIYNSYWHQSSTVVKPPSSTVWNSPLTAF